MQKVQIKSEFNDWREKARSLLNQNIEPENVVFVSTHDPQESLLSDVKREDDPSPHFKVPSSFLSQAYFVYAHRADAKWSLLYRLLWRITHNEPDVMQNSIDPDVSLFHSMYRSVRRDMHKMKAFVRFREVTTDENTRHFIAWYEPDHLILRLISPFFLDRFNGMQFTILTPDESLIWDGESAIFGPGSYKSSLHGDDEVENLWRTYYSSIFNPARIKEKAMKKEMAVRYWKNLPETRLIPELIRQAPARLQNFYKTQSTSAETWIPPQEERSLETLKEALNQCRACELYKNATHAVWGEGPVTASIVMVGEQPGNQEDLTQKPFVGPAGQLLDKALSLAGIDRSKIYLTNAVKHFRWIPKGNFRLHQKPAASHIAACKPWLNAELSLIKPKILICLGVTAAQAIFGKVVTLKEMRGKKFQTSASDQTWVTTHPSAILRTPPADQEKELDHFVRDLRLAIFE